ncbi:PREDICTED: uncharacterized protein LOC109356147 [Lupinus angustifolius]|uniref:uncharacterized protein LOC109356147 n=1 Tax=Lupinus angustifolius TaxID=3871 RepID=UPI00092FA6CB|nr:PREDICTED: uncharacterized protein LOC109356147 [Lupinus angustifolius]
MVGSGQHINFWKDNWFGEPLVELMSIPKELYSSLLSSVPCFRKGSCWTIPTFMNRHFPKIIEKIAKTTIVGNLDRLVWQKTLDGTLSLKASYNEVMNYPIQLNLCKFIWSANIAPSKSFTTWRIMHKKMPKDDNLRKRGCAIVFICNLCNSHSEEEDHLFLHCRFASKLWDWINNVYSIKLNNSSLQSIFADCAKLKNKQVKEVLITCAINTLRTIWFCRNQNRFEGILLTFSQAIRRIKRDTSLAGNSSPASASATGFIFTDYTRNRLGMTNYHFRNL